MSSRTTYLATTVQTTRAELMTMLYLSQIAESLAQNHSTRAPLNARIARTVSQCADRIEHIAQYALDLDYVTRARYLSNDVAVMRDILRDHAQDFHSMSSLPTVEDLQALAEALAEALGAK